MSEALCGKTLRRSTTQPLFVTLSKAGSTVFSIGVHGKTPAASNFRAWREPKRKSKNAKHFLRVWLHICYTVFSVPSVTIKQFLRYRRVHLTLYHIPAGRYAPLGFAPNGTNVPCFLRKTSTPPRGCLFFPILPPFSAAPLRMTDLGREGLKRYEKHEHHPGTSP